MPTYNGTLFLHQQIDSMQRELAPSDEIIIVDDGSSDGTREILAEWQERDHRVKLVLNARNVGVVKSVEKAVTLATNEVIFLADQDDIWLPGKIERGIARLTGAGVFAVLANSEIFVDNCRTGTLFFPAGHRPQFSIPAQLYKNDFIGCCMCFKKSILATALPFPARISMHDWWLGVNALAAGKAVFDDAPTLLYRRHSANASPSSRRVLSKVFRSRFFDFFALLVMFVRIMRR